MLNEKEEAFLKYWEDQRTRKKQFLRKFSIGLPLGVFLASAILINLFSGWYKKADMDLHAHASTIIVVIIALLGIVVFITVFSAHYRWDQNELQYQELKRKQRLEQEKGDMA
jgi:ATP/ADP translocase